MTTQALTGFAEAPVAAAEPASSPPPEWELYLYVLGQSPQSVPAIKNLRKICEAHLSGTYRIEVIDLLVTPRLARDYQIVAIPTLVRKLPGPIRKIIGDMSNTERTLVGLQLKPAPRKGLNQS